MFLQTHHQTWHPLSPLATLQSHLHLPLNPHQLQAQLLARVHWLSGSSVEAPTAVVVTIVLTLHTQTSSVPAGHVLGMTAAGGSVNPKIKGIAPALMPHRLQAPLMTVILPAIKAAAAAVRTARGAVKTGKVAVKAAVAAGVEVQVRLLEVAAVWRLVATLAPPVRVHQVLGQVQRQDARCACCFLSRMRGQSCDAYTWMELLIVGGYACIVDFL